MKIPILIALPLLAVAATATAQFAPPAEDRAAVTVDDSGVLTAPTAAELLGANPALTGDTEWDTTAKINAATTDDDFVTLAEEQTITGAKTFTSPVTVDGTGVTAEAFLLQPTGDIVFTEETGDFITILRAKEPTNTANVLELPDRSGTLLTEDYGLEWDGFGARAGLQADGTDHGLIVRGSDTGGNAVIGWSVSGASAVKAVQEDHASSPAVNVYREVDLITTASDAAAYNVFQSGRAPVFSAQGGYGNPDYAVYANQEDGYRVDLDGETVDRGRVGFAAADATTDALNFWSDQSFSEEWDDTHDAWDGTTFTAPYSGMYRVSASWMAAGSGDSLVVRVSVDPSDGGDRVRTGLGQVASGDGSDMAGGSAVLRLEAGDEASLQVLSSPASRAPAAGVNHNYQTFSIYLQN